MAFSFSTTLLQPAYPGNDTFAIPVDDAQVLCDYMAQNSTAVLLEVFTATAKEMVIARACDSGSITVNRGMRGTAPQYWMAGACICYVEDVPLCSDEAAACDPCNPPNPWDMVVVGEGLEIDRTDPRAPVLRLKATGVTAGDYGGAEVNERGQFVRIPPGWPASALPLFDPCACGQDGGGGGTPPTSAGDITYNPCGFVGATNVQDAICQLEQWASGLSFDSGVLSVTAGDGIDITGSTTHPVVALQPVGISPGTYAGFEINEFGQVVNYTPTTVDHPTHTAVAPLHVSYDSASNTWTHTVDWADYTQPGVVQFVSVSDIQNGTVNPPQDEWAMTYEGTDALITQRLNALGVANFEINNLPVASGVQVTDDLAVYNYTTNQHERLAISDLVDLVSPVPVLLEYEPSTGTLGASEGVSGVSTTGVGVHVVSLSAAVTAPVIHVQLRGDLPLAKATVELTTATTVTVRTYDLEVVGGTLQATPADHPFYLVIHEAP